MLVTILKTSFAGEVKSQRVQEAAWTPTNLIVPIVMCWGRGHEARGKKVDTKLYRSKSNVDITQL